MHGLGWAFGLQATVPESKLYVRAPRSERAIMSLGDYGEDPPGTPGLAVGHPDDSLQDTEMPPLKMFEEERFPNGMGQAVPTGDFDRPVDTGIRITKRDPRGRHRA